MNKKNDNETLKKKTWKHLLNKISTCKMQQNKFRNPSSVHFSPYFANSFAFSAKKRKFHLSAARLQKIEGKLNYF